MPYNYRLVGYSIDLTELKDEKARYAVRKEVARLEEGEVTGEHLLDFLTKLRSARGVEAAVGAEDEERNSLLLLLRDKGIFEIGLGRTNEPAWGKKHSASKRAELLSPSQAHRVAPVELVADLLVRGVREVLPAPGSDSPEELINQVRMLSVRRSPKDVPRLFEWLRDADMGDSKAAIDLRCELYDALSWHETDEVRAQLLEGLRQEHDDVFDTISYAMWRQEDLVDELPALLDQAWTAAQRDEELCERYLEALLSGDDSRKHAAWIAVNYEELLSRIGRAL